MITNYPYFIQKEMQGVTDHKGTALDNKWVENVGPAMLIADICSLNRINIDHPGACFPNNSLGSQETKNSMHHCLGTR